MTGEEGQWISLPSRKKIEREDYKKEDKKDTSRWRDPRGEGKVESDLSARRMTHYRYLNENKAFAKSVLQFSESSYHPSKLNYSFNRSERSLTLSLSPPKAWISLRVNLRAARTSEWGSNNYSLLNRIYNNLMRTSSSLGLSESRMRLFIRVSRMKRPILHPDSTCPHRAWPDWLVVHSHLQVP